MGVGVVSHLCRREATLTVLLFLSEISVFIIPCCFQTIRYQTYRVFFPVSQTVGRFTVEALRGKSGHIYNYGSFHALGTHENQWNVC